MVEVIKEEVRFEIKGNKLERTANFVEQFDSPEIIGQYYSVLSQQVNIYENIIKSYENFMEYLSKEKLLMKNIEKLSKDVNDLSEPVMAFIKLMKNKEEMVIPLMKKESLSKKNLSKELLKLEGVISSKVLLVEEVKEKLKEVINLWKQ